MTKFAHKLTDEERISAGKYIFTHLIHTKLREDLAAMEELYGIQFNISAQIAAIPLEKKDQEQTEAEQPTQQEAATQETPLADPEE